MNRAAPPPLEWHPAYRDHTWLLGWLNGIGPYAGRPYVLVPRIRPIRLFDAGDLVPDTTLPEPWRLTRQKAVGAGVYVGPSYHWEWWVGVDQLGRMIAGESFMVYDDPFPQWSVRER